MRKSALCGDDANAAMVLMAAVVLPLPQGATTRLNVLRWKEDGDRTSYKKSPCFIGVFLLSLVKQRALPSLANYIITQIFCRFKFPHHQKRQVRANALSYSLLFFLTCDGSLAAPVRYTKMLQIF